MITLSAMSPQDAAVPILLDFSNALASGDSIASIVSVTASPAGLTIASPLVVAGARTGCAVQCLLTGGTAGQLYLVTAEIRSSVQAVQLARSVNVPVAVL